MTEQRINLWSSPRNISTAIMYAFAQLPEVAVVDEPLYAHYLNHQPTEAVHPGKAEILAAMEGDGMVVVDRLLTDDYGKKAVVFKQMTHHLVHLDPSFLSTMQNVLLIRSPREILRSFSKVVARVTAEDIGIPQQYALYHRLKAEGRTPLVVDATLLLQNPSGVLSALCGELDLNYSPAMLNWPAGPRPEDGVWAPYWYANVHASTGFQAYQKKNFTLAPGLAAIAERCQPAYAEMLQAALR